MRTIVWFTLHILGMAAMAVLYVVVATTEGAHARTEYMPCANEDSVGCVYDHQHPTYLDYADRSFLVTQSGNVVFLPHAVAHRLIYPANDLPLCVHADEAGDPDGPRHCIHDARHSGNGLGNSFYVNRRGGVWLLPHRIAHAVS